MREFFTLFICFSLLPILHGQNKKSFWVDVSEADIQTPKRMVIDEALFYYRTLGLNAGSSEKLPRNMPRQKMPPEANRQQILIQLPMPDGSLETFSVYESSNFMPGLAAKYPEIRSFRAESVQYPGMGGRFDLSPSGLHAALYLPQGKVFIEPYAKEQDKWHISYFARDVDPTSEETSFSCGNNDRLEIHDPLAELKESLPSLATTPRLKTWK